MAFISWLIRQKETETSHPWHIKHQLFIERYTSLKYDWNMKNVLLIPQVLAETTAYTKAVNAFWSEEEQRCVDRDGSVCR